MAAMLSGFIMTIIMIIIERILLSSSLCDAADRFFAADCQPPAQFAAAARRLSCLQFIIYKTKEEEE